MVDFVLIYTFNDSTTHTQSCEMRGRKREAKRRAGKRKGIKAKQTTKYKKLK